MDKINRQTKRNATVFSYLIKNRFNKIILLNGKYETYYFAPEN